jgi:hypothetical protein
VQASLFDVDPTVDESFILKPFFFAKFRSNLSAKFSSMVGSPSKGIGDPLELKPCLHSRMLCGSSFTEDSICYGNAMTCILFCLVLIRTSVTGTKLC